MKPRNPVLGLWLFSLLAIPILPQDLDGQSLWDLPSYRKSVALEISKPVMDYYDDLSALSSGIFLSVTWPLNESTRFSGELPMAYAGRAEAQASETGLAVGNPYLGLDIGKEESDLFWRFGVRLPLAPEDTEAARMVGMMSDYISRWGTFWEDILTVAGTGTYRHRTEDGFLILAKGGVDVVIPTNGGGGDSDLFGVYGGQAGYEDDTWSATGGIMGRAFLSGSGGSIADRTIHEFGARIGYQAASVQPSLFLRIPLDEGVRDGTDFVIGLGLRAAL
ncbi:MAG: hypothetical protein PVJ76_10370 [Gemmatimonadota bacterium]|jgi:hypothetical protein